MRASPAMSSPLPQLRAAAVLAAAHSAEMGRRGLAAAWGRAAAVAAAPVGREAVGGMGGLLAGRRPCQVTAASAGATGNGQEQQVPVSVPVSGSKGLRRVA